MGPKKGRTAKKTGVSQKTPKRKGTRRAIAFVYTRGNETMFAMPPKSGKAGVSARGHKRKVARAQNGKGKG